jgi:hypothetical protein
VKDGWYHHINYFSELSDPLRHAISLAARDGLLLPSLVRDIYLPFTFFIPAETKVVFLTSEFSQKLSFSDYILQQGVLSWSVSGTSLRDKVAGHSGLGWEEETKNLLTTLSEQYYNIVWVLVGSEAQGYRRFLDDAGKHLVLLPPPNEELDLAEISEDVNHYLEKRGRAEITWL